MLEVSVQCLGSLNETELKGTVDYCCHTEEELELLSHIMKERRRVVQTSCISLSLY